MITPNISRENINIIEYYGAEVILEPVICPHGFLGYKKTVKHTEEKLYHAAMTKLAIFKYDMFDKIIFLDSDVVLFKNIDHLFECPHMTAVEDIGFEESDYSYKFFNAGVMVIKPDKKEYENIINTMNSEELLAIKGLDDQDVLHHYYNDWKERTDLHLPYTYNVMGLLWSCNFYGPYTPLEIGDIYVFHMMGAQKVWRVSNLDFFRHFTNNKFLGLMILYSDMINTCIQELASNNLFSKDLNIIE